MHNLTYIYHKSLQLDIAYRLNNKEFRCKCMRHTCHMTLIAPRLITSWNISRAQFGKKLSINSGFRCQAHNLEVQGVPDSKHTVGLAIDIDHSKFDDMEKHRLKLILENNFDVVIEYPTFYHCHNE
jgi:uncharacterized protein YcbK (DUF882 family)